MIIFPDCWETSDGWKRSKGAQGKKRRGLLKIGTKSIGIQVKEKTKDNGRGGQGLRDWGTGGQRRMGIVQVRPDLVAKADAGKRAGWCLPSWEAGEEPLGQLERDSSIKWLWNHLTL